jgi:uronate dehydrogenase
MKTILITGAAGSIGNTLRHEFAGRYKLRLSDKRQLTPSADEIFVQADISKLPDVLSISKGADAIVHLGAYADEGPWETILRSNIVGCYNMFEAARLNGVKRVVFASSNHTLGFYQCDQKLDHHVYPKPDSRYGVSKVFGEMLGSLYAHKYGLEIFLIRIGHATPTPRNVRDLAMWISPRDLAQLVGIGIDHPNVHFEIVYGASGNTRSWYDNSNAERLGYRPLDNSESYAVEVLARKSSVNEGQHYQGGSYTQID